MVVKIYFATITFLTFVTMLGCSNSQSGFASKSSKASSGAGSSQFSSEYDHAERFEASFRISQSTQVLDLVWIVDNSSSMREETNHVISNMGRFVKSIHDLGNVHMAVIASNSDLLNAVTAAQNDGEQSQGHLYVNQAVGSNNALSLLASASCPVAQMGPQVPQGFICAKDYQYAPTDPVSINVYTSPVAGKLTDFYRPGSIKAFVVVTDDNAAYVDDKMFLRIIEESESIPFKKKDIVFFAFKGQRANSGPNCNVARDGLSYDSLSASTGGQVFDICESDWSQNFAKLTENVKDIVNNEFDLSKHEGDIHIVEVRIDGDIIGSEHYKVVDGKFILDRSAIKVKEGYVELIYDVVSEEKL